MESRDIRDDVDEAHADDEDDQVVVKAKATEDSKPEADDIDEAAGDEEPGYSHVIIVTVERAVSPGTVYIGDGKKGKRATYWHCQ